MDTQNDHFTLRFAQEKDTALILDFIRGLADYEHMLDQVEATEDTLRESLFARKAAEVLVGEYDGKAVAFALFFHNFSTFGGRPGIYLEDLFIRPEYRGKGFGRRILSYISKLAVERGCGRVEWSCLDWNKPSIQFYKSLGAVPQDEWTVYRLNREAFAALAGQL